MLNDGSDSTCTSPDEDWAQFVLVLEAVALLPVIAYWAVQTVEYWGGGSDRYRPAASSG